MELKKKFKKIGFIFGLKREMNLVSHKNNNIVCVYGYGKASKNATQKLIKLGVDIVINFDTSRMLLTEVPSIDSIISFFLKPADIAGLSIWTSSITAGVKSFPTDIYINKKIKIKQTSIEF